MKKRRRSVASYRAASLKAARTRRAMKQARTVDFGTKMLAAYSVKFGATLDDMLPPERTIDRLPIVEWGK